MYGIYYFFFCFVSVYKLSGWEGGRGRGACIRRGILRGLYVFRELGAYIMGSLGLISDFFGYHLLENIVTVNMKNYS